MTWADDMFAGCLAIAERMAERQAARREAMRVQRNARARQRYAITKLQPKKPKPVEPEEYDYEPPTSCFCNVVRMPPCSWCENGGNREEL